jgi:hypothetical protein
MPIAVQTHPVSPSELVPANPIQLQLFGEAQPTLHTRYAEVATNLDANDDSPIYEYLWTVSHVDCYGTDGASSLDKELSSAPVRVQLDFGHIVGWRISEPIGTVKYMSPAPRDQGGWLARSQKELEMASKASSLIPGGATASKWMEAVSQLESTSLPQSKGYDWSIAASNVKIGEEIRQRIVWDIPKGMFKKLDGLLTGGLAVTFIATDSPHADAEGSKTANPTGEIHLSATVGVGATSRIPFRKKPSPRRVPPSDYVTLELAFQMQGSP